MFDRERTRRGGSPPARADWRRHPVHWSWRDLFARERAGCRVGAFEAGVALRWLTADTFPE